MGRTIPACITAALLVGCAFEAGPARHLRVSLLSPPAEPVTTDRGWEIELTEARLFVHYVRFFSGEATSAETGHTHEHLLLALSDEEADGVGTIRLAHSHAAEEASTEGALVGELIVDAAIDLLAAPHELGEAVFACGAEAVEARVFVGPPEGSDAPEMHGAGLYLAGTATFSSTGAPVAFTAALPVQREVHATGFAARADEAAGLEIHVPRTGWFDGINFATLTDGTIEADSDAAELILETLGTEGLHVHVIDE